MAALRTLWERLHCILYLGAASSTRPARRSEQERQGDDVKRPQRAYLLRCWRANGGWCYSVERVGEPAQRRGFGSLEALMAFLREETESRGEDQEPDAARAVKRGVGPAGQGQCDQ